ncbi:MAG: hypothetical protein PHH37_05740 [Paludibacter sp.]|nr:hypothetical protein [Paludibacter sp.]
MSKIIEKISGMTVLVLGLISVVLVALIYFGGNATPLTVGEEQLAVPKFTDALIYWAYFLIGLTIAITVLLTIVGFVKKFIENPGSAAKTLIPLVLFVVIFVVAWLLGSPQKINIIGYEGTENVGFWAQFTDMIIYSVYTLFIVLALTIIGTGIYRKLK